MADFYYETSITVHGPWLIDAEQLGELDSVIAQQWQRLQAYREQKIEREVQVELQDAIDRACPKPEKKKEKDAVTDRLRNQISSSYYNSKSQLNVTFLLKGGKKLVAGSIQEAIEHAGISDTEVTDLAVDILVGEVNAHLEVNTTYDQVSCRVSPESLAESREAFAVLRGWIQKCSPKRWLWFWQKLGWLIVLFCTGSVILGNHIIDSFSKQPPSLYITNAVNLLKQGVSVTNEAKAVETILALQSGYNPSSRQPDVPKWWALTLCCLTLTCVVFAVPPRSHVGIGKGKVKVRLWRRWIRFCTVVIPTLIFSSFILPAFVSFVQSLFK